MRSLIELHQYKKCIFMFMTGFITSILSFVIYVTDPVKMIVNTQLTMTRNSIIFSLWRKPPVDVYVYVYLFNITNPEAFLEGKEKLKLNEVGPYVYQEILENRNVTWNDNGTVSYFPKRTTVFQPELSIGNPDEDFLTVPNIPMLGLSSYMYKAGFLVNYPFVQLANFLDSPPILNVTVHDYLWGYDDNLVKLAGTVIPSWIDFKRFGILDRMYDEGDNLFNMNILVNGNMVEEKKRYLSLEMMNGSPGLKQWGYVQENGNETRPENTRCNMIQGATEGTVFPYSMDRRAEFRIYRKAFCRPIPITFEKETEVTGLPGYQYTLPKNFADLPEQNPENQCYACYKGECMKSGLLDLTPCYYHIPAAASLPHFLDNPSLGDGIEGLNPSEEKHRTKIILQPDFGIPLNVHSRLQTNLVMRETRYNSRITPFNGLIVPLFWNDLVINELPFEMMLLVRAGLYWAPAMQLLLVIGLALGGVATMCWSLVRTLVVLQQQHEEAIISAAVAVSGNDRRESVDPRIPLGYPYTAIRILPAVKRITSKTDLFM